jgi:hypothetical protein
MGRLHRCSGRTIDPHARRPHTGVIRKRECELRGMYRYAPPGQMSWYSVQLPDEADMQSGLGLSVVVNMPS